MPLFDTNVLICSFFAPLFLSFHLELRAQQKKNVSIIYHALESLNNYLTVYNCMYV